MNFLLRKANEDDLQQTYEWARDFVVRQYSHNSKEISKDEHHSWFKKTLRSNDTDYLLLEVDEQLVGSIRLDYNGYSAKINYLIGPGYTGRGFGSYLVEHGVSFLRKQRPDIREVFGIVHKDNSPSVKIFLKYGFSVEDWNGEYIKFYKEIK